ncbi:MAG TPA: TIGR01777 family oxidoreductase [Nocardia sp.]|uniref:TIGR01777 family oxidoreductase n=1 Tax=Nocardia sp. TaxID=1821 RepID=UPI002B4AE126|nr:TIGR01777 family oxidoreductase [Nocardia sp.]HLS75987.1 TIGR01777 family oxidoreductase [Nocardia sp.]
MRIVVAGSSGHLGRNLVSTLRGEGHEVVTLVRRPAEGADEITWDPAGSDFDSTVLTGVDAVINLCGAPVAAQRWTPEYRQELRDSRILPTRVLARAVAERGVPVLLNASAAGWYGDSGDAEVDEHTPNADDFLGTMCRDWEAAAAPAAEAGARVVLLRTSNVLAADSMMVQGLRPLFKLGLGGKFGTGRQYVPWITLADWLSAVRWLLVEQVSGPVNLVAPEAVTNAVFTKAFARALRRPALITVPGALLKLIGGEAGAELLHGHRMVPKALVGSGFEFAHPTLESGLAYTFPR